MSLVRHGVRGGILLLCVLGAGVGAVWLCWPPVLDGVALLRDGRAEPPDRVMSVLLTAACAVVLLGALSWLLASVTACLWEVVRAPGIRRTPSPASSLLRPRLVRLVVGAAVGFGGLTGPLAYADSVPQAPQVAAGRPSSDSTEAQVQEPVAPALLEGLPVPDRPVGAGPPTDAADASVGSASAGSASAGPASVGSDSAGPAAVGSAETMRVRPGDSLWGITARVLSPDPTGTAPLGAQVDVRKLDRGWRVLYAANRGVLGPDPDLIHPGTPLQIPSRPPFSSPDQGAPQ